ncbi:uncharacterized protein LOC113928604 [Zalophus californianus]|uniref:Uncharacterized protein LOC113928604 n=1 Tax=Zalophus californianus TaxID=9704 RepID=A0A6J2DUS9_ZALCA|nr:uncharacterized protein LOC113928604 [Zalophus californianus]
MSPRGFQVYCGAGRRGGWRGWWRDRSSRRGAGRAPRPGGVGGGGWGAAEQPARGSSGCSASRLVWRARVESGPCVRELFAEGRELSGQRAVWPAHAVGSLSATPRSRPAPAEPPENAGPPAPKLALSPHASESSFPDGEPNRKGPEMRRPAAIRSPGVPGVPLSRHTA